MAGGGAGGDVWPVEEEIELQAWLQPSALHEKMEASRGRVVSIHSTDAAWRRVSGMVWGGDLSVELEESVCARSVREGNTDLQVVPCLAAGVGVQEEWVLREPPPVALLHEPLLESSKKARHPEVTREEEGVVGVPERRRGVREGA